MNDIDLLVIGAGPAGMAAAATAARHGLRVMLVDEQPAPGGQVHRGITARAVKAGSVSQADDERGAALAAEFRASGAQYRPNTQVWQMTSGEQGCRVYVSSGMCAECMAAHRVIVACGAMERPLPLPGWTLPGVMTVGAAQIRYKTTGWLPPAGTWLAGSGPLLWLYAAQVVESGGELAGLLDTTPRGNYWRALRDGMGALRNLTYLDRGLALRDRVRRAGVKVVKDVAALTAVGEGQLGGVRYQVHGRWHEAQASLLLLHHGVVPATHASRSLGARHRWDAVQQALRPETDAWGNLSSAGYAAAGDCAGIVGAEASLLQGRLAALEVAHAVGGLDERGRDRAAAPLRAALRHHLRVRPFLDTLFAPRAGLMLPADDVTVCRCESVSAGQLREAVRLGAMGPNQVKAFTRCGMGPCQGRMCGLAAAGIIAAARGTSVDDAALFNVRPPLKPLSLGELAALE